MEPRAAFERVSKPLVLLTRRMARVHIVLGRYNGTVVAWARLFEVETPCHSAVEQRAKLLHGYSERNHMRSAMLASV